VRKEPTPDGRVGFLKSEHNVFYTPLWFVGVAQSYRLFDWIDDRNFHTSYNITERFADGRSIKLDSKEIFPATLRGVLLQGYLHDVTWGRVPRNRAAEFKAGLSQRFANRFCRSHADGGEVEVLSTLERTGAHGAARSASPELLMLFQCRGSDASLRFPEPLAPSLAAR
jgi:hypothetical protein